MSSKGPATWRFVCWVDGVGNEWFEISSLLNCEYNILAGADDRGMPCRVDQDSMPCDPGGGVGVMKRSQSLMSLSVAILSGYLWLGSRESTLRPGDLLVDFDFDVLGGTSSMVRSM